MNSWKLTRCCLCRIQYGFQGFVFRAPNYKTGSFRAPNYKTESKNRCQHNTLYKTVSILTELDHSVTKLDHSWTLITNYKTGSQIWIIVMLDSDWSAAEPRGVNAGSILIGRTVSHDLKILIDQKVHGFTWLHVDWMGRTLVNCDQEQTCVPTGTCNPTVTNFSCPVTIFFLWNGAPVPNYRHQNVTSDNAKYFPIVLIFLLFHYPVNGHVLWLSWTSERQSMTTGCIGRKIENNTRNSKLINRKFTYFLFVKNWQIENSCMRLN